jgi:hypothetical protein
MKILLSLILLVFPLLSYGELLNCGYAHIDRLMIQGDREGEHGHENTLIVSLSVNNIDVMCGVNRP